MHVLALVTELVQFITGGASRLGVHEITLLSTSHLYCWCLKSGDADHDDTNTCERARTRMYWI